MPELRVRLNKKEQRYLEHYVAHDIKNSPFVFMAPVIKGKEMKLKNVPKRKLFILNPKDFKRNHLEPLNSHIGF